MIQFLTSDFSCKEDGGEEKMEFCKLVVCCCVWRENGE
jgi:hypothetical protein